MLVPLHQQHLHARGAPARSASCIPPNSFFSLAQVRVFIGLRGVAAAPRRTYFCVVRAWACPVTA